MSICGINATRTGEHLSAELHALSLCALGRLLRLAARVGVQISTLRCREDREDTQRLTTTLDGMLDARTTVTARSRLTHSGGGGSARTINRTRQSGLVYDGCAHQMSQEMFVFYFVGTSV